MVILLRNNVIASYIRKNFSDDELILDYKKCEGLKVLWKNYFKILLDITNCPIDINSVGFI